MNFFNIIIIIIIFLLLNNYTKENLTTEIDKKNQYYKIIKNIEYPGNNISITNDDLIDCANKCNNLVDCIGFSSSNINNICWLKKYIDNNNSIKNNNLDTYLKSNDNLDKNLVNFNNNSSKYLVIPNTEWHSNNILQTSDPYDKCAIKCDLDYKCVGFAINTKRSKCQLKSNISGKGKNRTNIYTYIKKI